ncbi:hypothetical protein C1637_16805 [Chryseobacterium lactis]|uniref:C1q domain-containing protein n=1 Tax=Chryseobacterium lactis TaxID=1241981 RepID=A0A3G6RR86_CHRLC|nr:hypothetical protein [Chryseobacterium lactis]AZA84148.1 hypothetical protein EG342_20645 [Chryseobacterium lactis]AZB04534.1 hypothetical protein EG341_11520 [Chryseobacterium lactis]PNW12703.1 hypothetical protein C1637_16805 [Chryseobacterium lactis]
MKIKINITYTLLACILFFSSGKINAQVGFFTDSPAQPLQIDAAKDNGKSPDASKLSNDVVVSSTGNLGLGLLNPITKVDLRSPDNKGLIGLGIGTQTPAQAGPGAIRYNAGGFMEYSDGEQWIALPLTAPTKALVNASKSSAQSIGSNTTTYISGWTETVDLGTTPNGDFDPSSGTFTAPRDGFYLVSFNITLANGNIPKNTFIETAIESDRSIENIQIFKTVNSYPAFQAGAVSNYISGNCNAIFNLKTGNTIKFSVKHNIGSSRNTLNDGKLNNLSISEL